MATTTSTKTIEKINENTIKSKGVQALANRPNSDGARYGESGLSAQQLKERFDRLPKEVIDKVNLIIEIFSGGEVLKYLQIKHIENGVYIGGMPSGFNSTNVKPLENLYDLLNTVADGDFAKALRVYTVPPQSPESLLGEYGTLQNVIYELVKKDSILSENIEKKLNTSDFNAAIDKINISVTDVDGGHKVTVTNPDGSTQSFVVSNGEKGDKGDKGDTGGLNLPIASGEGEGAVQQEGCTASGNYSFAEGQTTTAGGNWSHAEGFNTQAPNACGHAEGQGTKASGMRGHVEGYASEAFGDTSHAEGWETYAGGKFSHAEGRETQTLNVCAHAEGEDTIAAGGHSHAEGAGTVAGPGGYTATKTKDKTEGKFTHAEGQGSYAQGNTSHAEGYGTMAIGFVSHAEGYETKTTADGTYSHVEGYASEAQGNVTHSEGWGTIAIGTCAHSEGRSTIAEGNFSHSGGIGTKATVDAQTAIGKWNADDGDALFIIGNGTGDAEDLRSNCFAAGTDKSGNAFIKVGKTKVTEAQLQKLLAHLD